MYTPTLPLATLVASLALTSALPNPPIIRTRQTQPCFIIGTTPLPTEVSNIATSLQNTVTCSATSKTLSSVPDVTSGTTSFSAVDFTASPLTPLAFALAEFATATPLADTDLQRFQDTLNVYLATEVGIRSTGGNLAIKVPKFFLEMQVSRIQTAQGNAPKEPGLQVAHLRDKVVKNAAGESRALLEQVAQLAAQLE